MREPYSNSIEDLGIVTFRFACWGREGRQEISRCALLRRRFYNPPWPECYVSSIMLNQSRILTSLCLSLGMILQAKGAVRRRGCLRGVMQTSCLSFNGEVEASNTRMILVNRAPPFHDRVGHFRMFSLVAGCWPINNSSVRSRPCCRSRYVVALPDLRRSKLRVTDRNKRISAGELGARTGEIRKSST